MISSKLLYMRDSRRNSWAYQTNVYPFESYAMGTANENIDIDLLINTADSGINGDSFIFANCLQWLF